MPNQVKIPSEMYDEILDAARADANEGFCTECWEMISGVEPDARAYECEVCGALAVYGAEELMFYMSA